MDSRKSSDDLETENIEAAKELSSKSENRFITDNRKEGNKIVFTKDPNIDGFFQFSKDTEDTINAFEMTNEEILSMKTEDGFLNQEKLREFLKKSEVSDSNIQLIKDHYSQLPLQYVFSAIQSAWANTPRSDEPAFNAKPEEQEKYQNNTLMIDQQKKERDNAVSKMYIKDNAVYLESSIRQIHVCNLNGESKGYIKGKRDMKSTFKLTQEGFVLHSIDYGGSDFVKKICMRKDLPQEMLNTECNKLLDSLIGLVDDVRKKSSTWYGLWPHSDFKGKAFLDIKTKLQEMRNNPNENCNNFTNEKAIQVLNVILENAAYVRGKDEQKGNTKSFTAAVESINNSPLLKNLTESNNISLDIEYYHNKKLAPAVSVGDSIIEGFKGAENRYKTIKKKP